MTWTPLPEPRPRPQVQPYTPYVWPAGDFVALPQPAEGGGPPMFEALAQRRSLRELKALPVEALGALLWHSQRRLAWAPSPLGFELERRPAPSGGAIHPIHVLAFDPQTGAWGRYDGVRHGLHDLADQMPMLEGLVEQARSIVADPEATLLWLVAEPGKTGAKYENAQSVVWRDAGVLQGYLVAVAAGLGLGTCLLGMTGQAWAARLADQGQLAGVGAFWVGGRT